ncbi:hypothetical protein CAPTEDRAFT_201602 [Capitella teleta]|uniref:SAM domain-containing protein n=1 Tax=Capitella teleta TaxID=283909 RepID=R7V859_CAPTE|nr:hypothetical protein CAPTEDRAFT_201602 [Capitella teleta]|eukprot:ELU12556.1 hypothetical protein CAPTEDRAFT_201602 [Capitella teleta]
MRHNKRISIMFIFYQGILLLSSLINPSVCIFIISGGLYYAWHVPQALSTSLLIIVFFVFTVICLKCKQDTQLMVAKVLTMLFAMLMAAVTIGTIAGIVEDNSVSPSNNTSVPPHPMTTTQPPIPPPPPPGPTLLPLLGDIQANHTTTIAQNIALNILATPQPTNLPIWLPIGVTTLYLSGLIAIFMITALMHLTEAYCIFHGIWYLICLPSVSLVLLIYSLCNMTDRSWGTREEKKVTSMASGGSWKRELISVIKVICFCCKDKFELEEEVPVPPITDLSEDEAEPPRDVNNPGRSQDGLMVNSLGRRGRRPERTASINSTTSTVFHHVDPTELAVPVSRWLPRGLRDQYSDLFVEHGYDDTSLIAGMSDSDLKEIGVQSTPIRQKLLVEINELPDYEVVSTVPDHVGEWLQSLDLGFYQKSFRSSQIINTRDLETLKGMTLSDIKKYIGITKPGHLRRLMIGIQALRYPTKNENDIEQVKFEVEALETHNLSAINPRENDFWVRLRNSCLLPDSAAFAHDHDLKEKLTELRNSTLMAFYIVNAIWIILITTLLNRTDLNVIGTNPLGLCFLIIFGFVLVIQFVCMLIHRFSTLLHIIARTPLTKNSPVANEDDENAIDSEARRFRHRYNQLARHRYQQRVLGRRNRTETDRAPLITAPINHEE